MPLSHMSSCLSLILGLSLQIPLDLLQDSCPMCPDSNYLGL